MFLLLFFIIYDLIITTIFLIITFNMKRKENERELYIDELQLELVKAREKCYSKNKEE